MLLIDCPYCGPRPEIEFPYAGQAHIARPADPAATGDDEWADFLYMRTNTRGVHAERWRHAHGCGRFFNALRDTATRPDPRDLSERRSAARHRDGGRAMTGQRTTQGGRIDRTRPVSLHLRRPQLPGACRRHARLGAARQRRPSVRPLVQVSPPARHAGCRVRGAERAGDRRPRRRASHAEPARHAGRALRGPGRREPEPLAVPRLRSRRRQQPPVAAADFRLLLQDLHVAAIRVAPLVRAGHPARGRPCARAASPDPDRYAQRYAHCDVLVVGAGPAGLAAALAAAATGARVILCDEQAELGGSLLDAPAATIDGIRRHAGSPRRWHSSARSRT